MMVHYGKSPVSRNGDDFAVPQRLAARRRRRAPAVCASCQGGTGTARQRGAVEGAGMRKWVGMAEMYEHVDPIPSN